MSQSMFTEIAALSGDPSRASMLHALMNGRALTAAELARVAGITPQSASGHLGKMTAAGLLVVEKHGRHRYFRLATASVARMVESIMQVAVDLDPNARRLAIGPRDPALRKARTCYDHFAGQLGVALTDALIEQGLIELTSEAGLLTEAGVTFLSDMGLDVAPLLAAGSKRSGRVFCKPCLDWSERRPHLAGLLGSAIYAHSMEQGWTRRIEGTRAVEITSKGQHVIRSKFKVRDWPFGESS